AAIDQDHTGPKPPGMPGKRDSQRAGAHDAKVGTRKVCHIRHGPEETHFLCGDTARFTTGRDRPSTMLRRVDLPGTFPYRPHQSDAGAACPSVEPFSAQPAAKRGTVPRAV